MLESQLWELTSRTRNAGLRADLLIPGSVGLPDCTVDVTFTCPMALSFSL